MMSQLTSVRVVWHVGRLVPHIAVHRHFYAVELATLAFDLLKETTVGRRALHRLAHGRVAMLACTLVAEVIAGEEHGAIADKVALPVGALKA